MASCFLYSRVRLALFLAHKHRRIHWLGGSHDRGGQRKILQVALCWEYRRELLKSGRTLEVGYPVGPILMVHYDWHEREIEGYI